MPAHGHPRVASPSVLRVTSDHLELVKALLLAGRPGRALEALDAVWRPESADELTWYLRLWALAAEGRVLDALTAARAATAALPGSAAVAYLHAALERSAGDRAAAIEAALRAAAILPGRAEPEVLLESLLDRNAEQVSLARANPAPDHSGPDAPNPSPVAAALAGLALLHPASSRRPWLPALPAARPVEPAAAPERGDRRRLMILALATVVAAVWSVRQPLLAAGGLALTVAWVSRGRSVPRSPE